MFSCNDGNHKNKNNPLPLPSDKAFLYYRAPTEVSLMVALWRRLPLQLPLAGATGRRTTETCRKRNGNMTRSGASRLDFSALPPGSGGSKKQTKNKQKQATSKQKTNKHNYLEDARARDWTHAAQKSSQDPWPPGCAWTCHYHCAPARPQRSREFVASRWHPTPCAPQSSLAAARAETIK